MENKVILLDTSVLIDYFRKKDKSKTFFYSISDGTLLLSVSAITIFEIYTGASSEQVMFWENLFGDMIIFPFTAGVSKHAALVDKTLKRSRNQLDLPDLFIAATALSNNLPLATLNSKHFRRIEGLEIMTP